MDEQENTSQEQSNNRPWLYKKGQSGNPGGRPKGSISMKKWLADKFASMSEEEREEFIDGINKIDILKMAEGNPATNSDITTGGQPINIQIAQEIAEKNNLS
jgi:hypothetical protein